MSKQEIRERVGLIRKNLSDVGVRSNSIINKLVGLKEYNDALVVMSYISLDIEVDTKEFIKNELLKKKSIVVPFIEEGNIKVSKLNDLDLVEGGFKVLEPKKKEKYDGKIDLVVVPGIAFDLNGARVGFGKGFYDKFLSGFNGLKIGLAFEEQIVDSIPSEEHDVKMDMIITDKRTIRCGNGRD